MTTKRIGQLNHIILHLEKTEKAIDTATDEATHTDILSLTHLERIAAGLRIDFQRELAKLKKSNAGDG
jgi:hypothetical protein